MASIYIRKDRNGNKKYYGSLYIDNKRVRKYLGLTKRSAEVNLKKLEYNLLLAPTIIDKSIVVSFNEAVMSFLKIVERTGVKHNQVKIIKAKINWFKDYCYSIGFEELSQIKKVHAHKYIELRKSKSPSVSTLNKEIGFIKRFFNHCIDMEWLIINPFRSIRNVKSNLKIKRYYFINNDIKLIMSRAGEYSSFFTFLLQTGIRSTDAFNLTSKHIQGRYIVKQMNKTGDWLNIPLAEGVLGILEGRMKNQFIFSELQTAFKRRKCTNHLQAAFTPDFVRRNNINLHTFRHTYAHNMLNKGVPKEVLQTLLGHRSIKTTEIYANWVRKEELERWV